MSVWSYRAGSAWSKFHWPGFSTVNEKGGPIMCGLGVAGNRSTRPADTNKSQTNAKIINQGRLVKLICVLFPLSKVLNSSFVNKENSSCESFTSNRPTQLKLDQSQPTHIFFRTGYRLVFLLLYLCDMIILQTCSIK